MKEDVDVFAHDHSNRDTNSQNIHPQQQRYGLSYTATEIRTLRPSIHGNRDTNSQSIHPRHERSELLEHPSTATEITHQQDEKLINAGTDIHPARPMEE
jgi:hypothetical protein